MKESLMEIICCPVDKGDLELTVEDRSQEDGEILTGKLTCQSCGESYPIDDGIPNLLPPDMRENDE